MGRSVSYARDSVWVLYAGLPEDDRQTFCCLACGEAVVEADQAPAACPHCGHSGFRNEPAFPPDVQRDDFCEDLRAVFMQAFPSLSPCDKWLGREDYALLENGLVYIGVSQYYQLISLWCVPKPSTQWGRDTTPLAEQWAASIEDRAAWILGRSAIRLVRLGTMSNGEGVYRRIGPETR
ncbi:hypothetical protein [Xanthomonas hortorum]|uniref:Uncharacterized protein n=1 Tax=Xanthomonas hortorum pv. hederae TaxID=453603 RepID=A0A9X4BSH9_9XANT|nr:hypothetical protein [Xanthomonas hortorum]MCE4369735.1 hypothetical protein [Xanthomonas hortorum pv. hederae]MDC8638750.1 hypothetical protein [Xanthomonas hortorum pv. hederae]PPU86269.1 hypothetical protein XhhCFBP4925_00645 [Xanthomonas hortorum pv. hederae]PUF01396.1 hypothetical protein C7T87_03515 [Xanthomonas hortorum pv. hederae]